MEMRLLLGTSPPFGPTFKLRIENFFLLTELAAALVADDPLERRCVFHLFESWVLTFLRLRGLVGTRVSARESLLLRSWRLRRPAAEVS